MLLTLMWMGVAAGMIVLISAAMKVQHNNICKGYNIKIEGSVNGELFTSKDQISKLLKTATKGEVKGQPIADFDLARIEDLLEQSAWIYNTELYFDNMNVLHVNVMERKPLARVFTNAGESFYIDEAGKNIPLSDKVSLDLPVFTGYPSKKVFNKADSTLMENVIATASFISDNSFWSSQVSQININNYGADCWSMEMIPVVGNHRVDLGDGSDIASKFHRLYLFYDQVLKRVGFDKYQRLDVQYNGQVIGIKNKYTEIDSIQLRKNIESLLQQSRSINDMLEVAPAVASAPLLIDTSAEAKQMYSEQPQENNADSITVKPEIKKANIIAKPVKEEKPKLVNAGAEAKKKVTEKSNEVMKEEPVKSSQKTAPVKNGEVKKMADKTTTAAKKPQEAPKAKAVMKKITN